MTLEEELDAAAEADPGNARLFERAAAMIRALKEETLSLINKPLRAEDWEFACGDPYRESRQGWWLVTVIGMGGFGTIGLWARRRP